MSPRCFGAVRAFFGRAFGDAFVADCKSSSAFFVQYSPNTHIIMKKLFLFLSICCMAFLCSCESKVNVSQMEGNYSVDLDVTVATSNGGIFYDYIENLPMQVVSQKDGYFLTARGCVSGLMNGEQEWWSNHSLAMITESTEKIFYEQFDDLGKLNYHFDGKNSLSWTESDKSDAGVVTIKVSAYKTNKPIYLTFYAGKYKFPCAYTWRSNGENNHEWPGFPMTKTNETINGYDVYVYASWEKWDNIIFNDVQTKEQTDDLIYRENQIYVNGSWEKYEIK